MNFFDVFLGVLGKPAEGGAQHGNVQTGGAETGEIVVGKRRRRPECAHGSPSRGRRAILAEPILHELLPAKAGLYCHHKNHVAEIKHIGYRFRRSRGLQRNRRGRAQRADLLQQRGQILRRLGVYRQARRTGADECSPRTASG